MDDLTLQRLPSPNASWQATVMPKALAHALSWAREHAPHQVTRAFWLAFGSRRRPYRLLRSDGNVVAMNRKARWRDPAGGDRAPAPPPAPIYGLRVWRELKTQPGSFAPWIDPALSLPLLGASSDAEAIGLVSGISIPRGSDGLPLSFQLIAMDAAGGAGLSRVVPIPGGA